MYQVLPPMQERFFHSVLPLFSDARLAPYRNENGSNIATLGRYLWNTALCESFYPAMNGLEISLRNSLHRAITDFHQTEDWFESVLSENTPEYWKRQLASINRRLREEGKVGNPDQVVASLEFGFWTHLFTSKYEGKGKIWPGLLENVFPHMPRRLRTRQQLHNRLDKCRRLRNRISHHEPIWRSNDLVNTHQEMIDLICWINPQVRALVQLLDRFQEIHSNGIPHYRTLVDEFLNQR